MVEKCVDGERWFVCNHCGEQTQEITPDDDWSETDEQTLDSQFEADVAHFCPLCSRGRELLQEAEQVGDIPPFGEMEKPLENVRKWETSMSTRDMKAVNHFLVYQSE